VTFDLDLVHVYGSDHRSHAIGGQGQRSRLRLALGSQFGTRPVGLRYSINESFLIPVRDAARCSIRVQQFTQ